MSEHLIYTLNTPQLRVRMRLQGKLEALFTFNRPKATAIRQYFSEVRPRFRSKGKEMKMIPAERDHAVAVLDKYLVSVHHLPSLEPFEDSLDDIKAMLKQPVAQGVLFTLVNSGLFGLEVLERDEDPEILIFEDGEDSEPAAPKLSFGSMFKPQPIYLGVKEWDVEGLDAHYYIRVNMQAPNGQQQRALENAQPLVRKKRGDFEHQEEVGACQALFGARVQSIDMCQYFPMDNHDVEPKPCTLENRGEWLPFVPYQLVSTVLAEEQMKGQVGND